MKLGMQQKKVEEKKRLKMAETLLDYFSSIIDCWLSSLSKSLVSA